MASVLTKWKGCSNKQNQSRKLAPFGIILAVLGLLLFAYFVTKAGVPEIVDGIRRLGTAFLLVLVLSGFRHMVRSLAWMKCLEPPFRLRFRHALAARLMGDALGNIVPLANVAVTEPAKAVFVRDRVPLMTGLSAIAVENICYSFSVVLFIFSGTTALLLAFSLPKPLRYASIGTLAATAAIGSLGYLVICKQWKFLSGTLSILRARGLGRNWIEKAAPRAQTFEDRIYGFNARNPGRLLPILALEVCFHLAGIAEIYATLSFISEVVAPTLLTAFILESVNRVINIVFKFVPLRAGIDEAGTGMLSQVLGFTTAIGVTLAIVRKARDIFWAAIGIGLILRREFSTRIATEAEDVVDEAAFVGPKVPVLPAGKSGLGHSTQGNHS